MRKINIRRFVAQIMYIEKYKERKKLVNTYIQSVSKKLNGFWGYKLEIGNGDETNRKEEEKKRKYMDK